MRPINQKPTWIESILLRPIKVECWACLQFSWLHRNQQTEAPSDWTCPNCLTHQRRNKNGEITPVPEMFDGNLNEEVTSRVSRSIRSRKKPTSGFISSNSTQNDFFCEMCNSHQRVVYQLLSNYIPDEEDENYEAYYENADTYKRQLEERYPLACKNCLEKVQGELAKQNYKIKSSLLNSTLSKSRGDRISASRKHPEFGWLFKGSCWLCSHGVLLSMDIINCIGLDSTSNWKLLELLGKLSQSTGYLTFHNGIRAISKTNYSALMPWSFSPKNLLSPLNEAEQLSVAVVTLAVLSSIGLFWDPLQFMIQKFPRKRVKTRYYYALTKAGVLPILILQFITLFSGYRMDSSWAYGILFILHAAALTGFVSGRFIQDLGEVKLDIQNSHPVSRKPQSAPSNRVASPQVRSSETIDQPKPRSTLKSTNSFLASNNSFEDAIRSRSGSPEINEINWSPKKPMNISSSRGAFGMYRDPSQSRMNDSAVNSNGRPGVPQDPFSQMADTKFRSRAYEPSPLANPSIVTNMSLSNMSLGEMFGFPSAKFQPPENHFAHRTGSQEARTDPWKFRKADERGSNLGFGQSATRRTHSKFSRDVDDDMDEDEDEDEDTRRLNSLGRRPRSPLSMDTDADNTGDMFSSFGFGATSSNSNSNGKEIFAPQRYFPPEPETGLEDNFFGIVKIVDDYLPPQQGPRSIAGRNLMLKKRMARRWLILLLACRSIGFWKAGDSSYSWIFQIIYLGVILHATIFWCLDEYRLFHRHLSKKSGPVEKKKSPTSVDPFEPTTFDKSCSYIIFLLLATRLFNIISMILVDNFLSGNSSPCSSQRRILREKCQQPTLMDWSPSIIQWINSDVEGNRSAWNMAYNVGWVHDITVATLLIVLMVFGAGPSTTAKPNSKVKERGD